MIKTDRFEEEKDHSENSVDNSGNILIKGEKKPWNEGTIHILWPSVTANKDDEKYVAWCRENAKGKLKKPEEMLPIENPDRFCRTCLQKAKDSYNIEEPEFVDSIIREQEQ